MPANGPGNLWLAPAGSWRRSIAHGDVPWTGAAMRPASPSRSAPAGTGRRCIRAGSLRRLAEGELSPEDQRREAHVLGVAELSLEAGDRVAA
jgi:hypothetical protein